MIMIVSHLLYLAISLVFTVWVARTLFKNGRIFIVDAFQGNEQLADSINHLLLVGFYLINIGFVSLALKYGDRPVNTVQSIEYLSTKVGLVLVILGIMHFFNLGILSRMRRKQMQSNSLPPVRSAPLKAKFIPETVA
ncbi:MAG: hypothetical protein P1V97_00845 [Planctomycetota bacterium]|nr:hypothetical protein [Planctomycetota bacterium]